MRKEWLVRVGVLVMALMISATSVWSAGIGFYGATGSGSADWESDTSDWEDDHDFTEFGFLFDTAVAQNSSFNYRMTIGYKNLSIEQDDGDEFEADGYTWGHTFGFALAKTRFFRLWFGPKLEFSYLNEEDLGYDLDYLGAGIGPALGLNLHAGPVVTFAITGGYQYTWYNVEGTYYGIDEDYDVTEGMPYANAAIIFRMGDNY